MPEHLDEEQLNRLLHGEAISAAAELSAHLESCPACRARLDAAKEEEEETFSILRQLDHSPPALTAGAVALRARQAGWSWGRWAAGILLFIGMAGAAYATPGSPFREWILATRDWIVGTPGDSSSPAIARPEEQAAGIAHPPGSRFVVAFTAPDPLGQVRIRLSDSDEVLLRAPSGSAGFTSGAAGVTVEIRNPGATFDLEVPRSAARVEVMVSGKQIWLKDNARITAPSASRTPGEYLLPLKLPPSPQP